MRSFKLALLLICSTLGVNATVSKVDSIFKSLSSDEKLAQLFVVIDSASVDTLSVQTIPSPAYFLFSGNKIGNLHTHSTTISKYHPLAICNIENGVMQGVNSQTMPTNSLLEGAQLGGNKSTYLAYLAQKAKAAGSPSFSLDFSSPWAATIDFRTISISSKRFISSQYPALKGLILNTPAGFLYVDVFAFPANIFDQVTQVPINPQSTPILDEPFIIPTNGGAKSLLSEILAGEGLLFTTDYNRDFHLLKEAIANNLLPKAVIDNAVRKSIANIIAARNGLSFKGEVNTTLQEISIVRQSVTLIANENLFLPIQNIDSLNVALITLGNDNFETMASALKFYVPRCKILAISSLDSIFVDSMMVQAKHANLIILAASASSILNLARRADLELLKQITASKNTILTTFCHTTDLQLAKQILPLSAIVSGYDNNRYTQQIVAENIFGGGAFIGKSPFVVKGVCDKGQGITSIITRLGRALPEEVDMNSEALSKIDDVVAMGISQHAMPGCQVLVARNGKIVMQKAYGSSDYELNSTLSDTMLYDIASVTKIIGSLPQVMKLVDQGVISVDSTLQTYLPNLKSTNKGNLTLLELLTHHAGLVPFLPFYQNCIDKNLTVGNIFSNRYNDKYSIKIEERLYFNRYAVYRTDLVSAVKSDAYSVHVARDMYLNKSYIDSMYAQLDSSRIRNRGKYLYSDCGYYYFKNIVEKFGNHSLDTLLNTNFLQPLGMFRTCYNPLTKFPLNQIVPTEQDLMFRRQTVRGYVHDPGAAMLGGVGGHAGLFSTSSDMAIMMQMYLNGGTYGGKRYISEATLKRFTSYAYPSSRRGIGFDKREPDAKKINPVSDYCSTQSFGHSGFTGTLVWVDPKYNLVYVFLSNRIHPNAYNKKLIKMDIRSKVQDAIYQSIIE